MGIGAVSYLASFLLLALMQPIRYYYWAFIFPALVLAVVGADLQFNVANVCTSSFSIFVYLRVRC